MHTNVWPQTYSREILGRPRCKRYNIKMDQEIGPEVAELTDLDEGSG
jgi:hypothetical protein